VPHFILQSRLEILRCLFCFFRKKFNILYYIKISTKGKTLIIQLFVNSCWLPYQFIAAWMQEKREGEEKSKK